LNYLVHTHTQTDKQTKTGKNITSLAEVTTTMMLSILQESVAPCSPNNYDTQTIKYVLPSAT